MLTIFRPFALLACRTILVLSLGSIAQLSATTANVTLGSPDIIEISVKHLNEVQAQLRDGLGISWGPQQTSFSIVKVGDDLHEVQLKRVYSVSSHPYIELIQATPQIGPWAPFNDEFGERPKSSMVWRVEPGEYARVKHQMDISGMTRTAVGLNFAYYESAEGVQLEIIRGILAPDPQNGVPNTPPAGKIDFGAMSYISIPLVPDPVDPANAIPHDDTVLKNHISAATGGGITWDINVPVYFFIPYIRDADPTNPVFLDNPYLRYSCNPTPFINFLVINPLVSPWGATAHSTTFSHAWVPPGSGFDPAGTAIMTAYENQLLAANFTSIIRLDAQTLGLTPYSSNFLRYFVGIDNVNIQVVSIPASNITQTCTGCVGGACD